MPEHVSALLIDAPVDRHFAQLHRDEEQRTAAVTLYLETGLRRGAGVVMLASDANTGTYMDRLAAAGLDPERRRRSGQLVVLDAETALARFMRGSTPDWLDFRRVVGGALESVQLFGGINTRAYGEMVDILWRKGETAAAVRLEHYWNDLARLHPFSLFCTYAIDHEDGAAYRSPLEEIGHVHTDVIETEDDVNFREAVDAASLDIFGIPLCELMGKSGLAELPGEERLPAGQRTMLWVMRHLPDTSAQLLARARHYIQQVAEAQPAPLGL